MVIILSSVLNMTNTNSFITIIVFYPLTVLNQPFQFTTVIKLPFVPIHVCDHNTEFSFCTGGVDYTSRISVRTFNTSSLSTEFTIPILNDNIVETDEVFLVELFNFGGPLIKLVPESIEVTILDDDIICKS